MSKELAMQENEKEAQNIQWDIHETEEAKPLEFTEENKAELFGLEPIKANEMVSGLKTTLAERKVLKDAYIEVIALEITTENLSTFKELRLKIVKNRTQGLTKWKEKEKAFYLAGGNFIQAIYNKEIALNEEMESKLLEAEKFFENQEKEKAHLLNLERIEKVRPYVQDADNMNFSDFDDESFDDFILGKKTRFENEQKEREAEALRIETERLAEIERQKSIEVENAKLKAESEKQRLEFEAKQKANHEANEKLRIEADKQVKIQAEKDAEIKRLNDEKEKAENERITKEKADKLEADKLAKAPIKKQLSVWVDSFNYGLQPLENETTKDVILKFEAFKKWAKSQIEKL